MTDVPREMTDIEVSFAVVTNGRRVSPGGDTQTGTGEPQ